MQINRWHAAKPAELGHAAYAAKPAELGHAACGVKL